MTTALKRLTRNAGRGTSKMGEIVMDFDSLVEVFGKPNPGSRDGKTQAEWVIRTPQGVAVIYDYKSEFGPKHNRYWNVGGRSKGVVNEIVGELMHIDMCAGCGYHSSRCKNQPECPLYAPF